MRARNLLLIEGGGPALFPVSRARIKLPWSLKIRTGSQLSVI